MSLVAGVLANAVRVFDSAGTPRYAEQTPRQRAEERLAKARTASRALDELEKVGDPLAILLGLGAALRG